MRIADVLAPDTAASTSTANNLETLIDSTDSEYTRTARRLLANGTVTDTTTFADLDEVYRQDIKNQTALRAIKDYFDSFDVKSYSVEQGNLLIALAFAWLRLDPEDFIETFCHAAA